MNNKFGSNRFSDSLVLIGPERVEINSFPAILGRNRNLVDVTLTDLSISRKHCEIINRDNNFYIRDLGSSFGTYLNNEKLRENAYYQILDNDNIRFGDITYNLKINQSILRNHKNKERFNNVLNDNHNYDKKTNPTHNKTISIDYSGGKGTFPKMMLKSLQNSNYYIIDKTPFFIGSNINRNDLVLPLIGLSSRHLEIKRENEKFYICDLNSTNGTWLNDRKLSANKYYPLGVNDVISLANDSFLFDYY